MPDWVKLRDDFPITKKYAYLANAPIAPIPMPVYNEVSKFYKDILNHGQTSWDVSVSCRYVCICIIGCLLIRRGMKFQGSQLVTTEHRCTGHIQPEAFVVSFTLAADSRSI